MAKGLGNTSSEAPLKKYEGPGESYSRAGGAGTGGYKSAGLGSGSGEPPRLGLNSRTLTSGLGSRDGKELNLKSPAVPKESRRKGRVKEEVKVTEDSANGIRSYLKLHCMRTRSHDKAVDFLYGRNQENQIYFDLIGTPLTISKERIEEGLAHLKLEDVLQYVALPRLHLEKRPVTSKLLKRPVKAPKGKGRKDMVFLFDFLRSKGVKRVIRVIVDDKEQPAHSDEQIERGHWGGLESSERTDKNVQDFRERLRRLRPGIEIEVKKERQPEKQDPTGGLVGVSREQVEQRHRWLTSMDEFADFIQNIDPPLPLHEPVTIALIDDGVDINEQSLHAKIIGGRSFCPRDSSQNLNQPYYITTGGHGTVMASLIYRVCPKAQLYVLKLEEHVSEHSTRTITAKSAAEAVRAAIAKRVHIISMSWTIERTTYNGSDISELESAIEAAANERILMFCAPSDQGIAHDSSFPAACSSSKRLFKIGAAQASGAVWKMVGDPADVDFIFPGHNVVKERPNDAPVEKCKTLTGSSVATAIAAGLAGLVLHCVQLGALNKQASNQQHGQGDPTLTMEDFKAMKGHERMKEAFLAIGTTRDKYVKVWDVFRPAAKQAERAADKERRMEIVTGVARRLKTRKTFE
ncbi:MAG: hypothetical protein Q9198_006414 [Flavoplaca austrocitrina]